MGTRGAGHQAVSQMAAWWPARKSEPCQDAAATVNTITVGAACLPGHLAPGACTWYHQVLPGTTRYCQVLPGTYQVPTRYKHLVNEYLTAPTRLPHNSCRLSISVYTPPNKGEFKRSRGRAGSETSPGS